MPDELGISQDRWTWTFAVLKAVLPKSKSTVLSRFVWRPLLIRGKSTPLEHESVSKKGRKSLSGLTMSLYGLTDPNYSESSNDTYDICFRSRHTMYDYVVIPAWETCNNKPFSSYIRSLSTFLSLLCVVLALPPNHNATVQLVSNITRLLLML